MTPEQPEDESTKKKSPAAKEAPAPASERTAKVSDAPETLSAPPSAPAEPETKTPKGDGARRGRERTRSIVMMVLATLALTAVLTLVAETVMRPTTPQAHSGSHTADTPPASAVAAPAMTSVIIVSVGYEGIQVDGLEVSKTAPLIEGKQVGNIPGLKQAMDLKRGNVSTGGRVGLEVEKGMPTNVIKSVFLTLALAQYRDVHLVNALPDAGSLAGDR